MKRHLLLLLAAFAMLTGCKKESEDFYSRGFKFTRADISGAEYLTIAKGSDVTRAGGGEGSSTLFKIDDKGNMIGVVFYAESLYDEDGNKTGEVNVSTDLSICPKYITDYGEKYLLFTECDITPLNDKYLTAGGGRTSEFYHILHNSGYYGDGGLHFLIRKTDGAIFKINDKDIYKFPRAGQFHDGEALTDIQLHYKLQYNASGDLYMANDVLSKLKLENDKILLQTLTQPDIRVDFMMLDKYSNVYTNDDYNLNNLKYGCLPAGQNLYFANGSVMGIPMFEFNHITGMPIILIDNELYAIKCDVLYMDDARNEPWELLKLPNQLPLNPSNPNFDVIATITPKFVDYVNKLGVYDSQTQTVIFGFLVYDKATKTLSQRNVPDEFIIEGWASLGDAAYNRDGIAYQMQNNNTQVAKYNIFDLTKQVIACDRGAVPPFVESKIKQTSTEYIEYGIKNSNGNPIRVHTELQTGRVTFYEDTDKRTITELVKVS